jgi:hypothetical protein
MSTDALQVCPAALRRSAGMLAGVAQRFAHQSDGPLDAPDGALPTAVALTELAATVRRRVAALAADTADAAAQVRRAAAEYEAADDRAVRRTRGVG